MIRRGLNIPTEALLSAALQRDEALVRQEHTQTSNSSSKSQFVKVNKNKDHVLQNLNYQSPTIEPKTLTFANEVQARINAQRITDRIRETAMKRSGI